MEIEKFFKIDIIVFNSLNKYHYFDINLTY